MERGITYPNYTTMGPTFLRDLTVAQILVAVVPFLINKPPNPSSECVRKHPEQCRGAFNY
jgi:hypothetical protein